MRHGRATFVLRRLWHAWKRLGRRIGDVQARVLLTVFYFTVVAPFALVVRWGSDPLALKPGAAREWRSRADAVGDALTRARRQF